MAAGMAGLGLAGEEEEVAAVRAARRSVRVDLMSGFLEERSVPFREEESWAMNCLMDRVETSVILEKASVTRAVRAESEGRGWGGTAAGEGGTDEEEVVEVLAGDFFGDLEGDLGGRDGDGADLLRSREGEDISGGRGVVGGGGGRGIETGGE